MELIPSLTMILLNATVTPIFWMYPTNKTSFLPVALKKNFFIFTEGLT